MLAWFVKNGVNCLPSKYLKLKTKMFFVIVVFVITVPVITAMQFINA